MSIVHLLTQNRLMSCMHAVYISESNLVDMYVCALDLQFAVSATRSNNNYYSGECFYPRIS